MLLKEIRNWSDDAGNKVIIINPSDQQVRKDCLDLQLMHGQRLGGGMLQEFNFLRCEVNEIKIQESCEIFFKSNVAKNNILVISCFSQIKKLKVCFFCSNSICYIGNSRGAYSIEMGEDCLLTISNGVSSSSVVDLCTAEGTCISIGDDCMFAKDVCVKTNDYHPIFDVRSGKRVNVSKDIVVRDHVWVGAKSFISKGTEIGTGSVVGYGSYVSGFFPNNCCVAGIPAKVIKRDIAWERPMLNKTEPFYNPNSTSVRKSTYWYLTEGE